MTHYRPPAASAPHHRIVIIGAGISGLCMAMRLKHFGIDDFIILESSQDIGGTWSKNRYPGAGCDIPSFLYSYSFAPNHHWTQKYASQTEILAYLRKCVKEHSLGDHLKLGVTVESMTLDESRNQWMITTGDGEHLSAQFVISAVGQLDRPYVPPFDGLAAFEGPSWHSARWNHDVDLDGKTVAVIGNGASAIQLVPELAQRAERLIVFARSPNWIHPKNNYRYPRWAHWIFGNIPLASRLHRGWIFAMCELRFAAFSEGSKLNLEYSRWLRSRMKRQLRPEQFDALLPTYAPGCKRILLSSDYLSTLSRNNVDLIAEPVTGFDPHHVKTCTHDHPADVVIFATGFQANSFLQPMRVLGRGRKCLEETWAGRPRAYFGMAVPNFPNFFMLYGPNTNLGHNSILFMVECQVNRLVKMFAKLTRRSSCSIEVADDDMDRFDQYVRNGLAHSIWAGNCRNWYRSADGSIPNNWCGTAVSYWYQLKRARGFRVSG